MTEPGGTEPFACKQAVGYDRATESMQVLKQQAHFLKSALLAGGLDSHKDLRGGKDGCESIHGSKKPHYARTSMVAP